MGITGRLEKLEQRFKPEVKRSHVISITRGGEPMPPSVCPCEGVHVNVVVVPPRRREDEYK